MKTALDHARTEGRICARNGTSPTVARWAGETAFKTAAERDAFLAGYHNEAAREDRRIDRKLAAAKQ